MVGAAVIMCGHATNETRPMTSAAQKPWHKHIAFRIGAVLALALLTLATCNRLVTEPENLLLERLIDARNSLATPGETFAEAATRLSTVDAITAFMANEMAPAVYPDRLYGPQQAFTLRMANERDAVVLLHALLTEAGHEATLGTTEALTSAADGWIVGQPLTEEYRALGDYIDADLSNVEDAEQRLANAIETVNTAMDASLNIAETLSNPFGLVSSVRGYTPPSGPYPVVRLSDGRILRADGSDVTDQVSPDAVQGWSPDGVELLNLELWLRLANGRVVTLSEWEGSAASNLNLSFVPLTGAAAFYTNSLTGNEGASLLWQPLLQAGTETIVGNAFDISTGASIDLRAQPFIEDTIIEPGPAPATTQLNVLSGLVNDTGRVSVRLEHDAPAGSAFSTAHLDATQNDESVPLRIEAQSTASRPLVLIIDRSGSMNERNRLVRARESVELLLAGLPANQEIAVLSFANETRTEIPLQLAGDSSALVEAFAAQEMIANGGNGTGQAIAGAQALVGARPADFVLFNDADADNTGNIPDVLDQYGSALHTVAIGVNASPYESVSTTIRQLNQPEGVIAIVDELGDVLLGGLRVSFAPIYDGKQPGDLVDFTISLRESGLQAQGQYPVVENSEASPPQALGITVELGRSGRMTSELGIFDGSDPLEVLLAQHSLIVGTGAPREQHLARRMLDELISTVSAFEVHAGNGQFIPDMDGTLNFDNLAIAGQVRQLTEFAGDDGLFGFRGPLVIIRSAAPDFSDEHSWSVVSQINVLSVPSLYIHQDVYSAGGLWLTREAPASELWRSYAALSGAEAATLGGRSVPELMVQAGDVRWVWGDTLRSADPNLWAHHTGNSGGGRVAMFRTGPTGAKGARAAHIAGQYQETLSRLDFAATVASVIGQGIRTPAGHVQGISSFMIENVRQYCHAAVHLGFVTEVIAGEDTGDEDWGTFARRECGIDDGRDQGERLIRVFARAYEDIGGVEVSADNVVDFVAATFGIEPDPLTALAQEAAQGAYRDTSYAVTYSEVASGVRSTAVLPFNDNP